MNRREQYLAALGVDVWTPRQPPRALADMEAVATAGAVAAVVVVSEAQAPLPADADWPALQAEVAACTRCSLCSSRTQTVFGTGNRRADLLVIGEAPGAEEDRQGEPFVGRAGQLLNSMLRALGRSRESVYIANVLKCRPPGNRDPSPAEVACCLPYLQRQIELVAPRLVLVVGRIAAQSLLATEAPLARLRGRLHRVGAQATPAIVTYHPAYLLRSPAEKRRAWEDLKRVRAQLDREASLKDGLPAV